MGRRGAAAASPGEGAGAARAVLAAHGSAAMGPDTWRRLSSGSCSPAKLLLQSDQLLWLLLAPLCPVSSTADSTKES